MCRPVGLLATVSTGTVWIRYQTVGLIHTLEQCLNRMQTVGLIHTLEQCLNRMQTVGLIHTLEQCLNRMQTVGLIHTLEQCLNRMQTVGLIHTLEQCLNRMQTVGLIHTLEQCLKRMQTVGLIHTLEQCFNPLRHRLVRQHGNADALSRWPCAAAGCKHCPRAQLAPTVATLRTIDGEAGCLPLSPAQVQEAQERDAALTHHLDVIVFVLNENDNSPVFSNSQYVGTVYELSPVDTSVDTFEATDLDQTKLYYQIEPVNSYFKTKDATSPIIVVKSVIDYDIIKSVTFHLIARDTSIPAPDVGPSNSATATITINILDADNRPPWFQPCTESTVGTAKICLSSGYSGMVNLTEQEVGVLPLEPGPVYAIDGDKGRMERIIYKILGGNEAEIFNLDENSGNITMVKAADVVGPVVLTIVASQFANSDQFATSSVTFDVVKKSKHPPKFEEQQYEGYCDPSLDSMVMEDESSNRPLRVQARDADFADGVNPDVQYQVQDSSDFIVTTEGFILLKREVSPGTVLLQIQAVDTFSGEVGTAMVSVQVPTEGELDPKVPGEYREEDMAALGASLAVLVVLCLVVISLLVFRIRKGDADWKKLSEASIFRSSFAHSSGGLKNGMQYTNNGFQNDEDTGSVSSNLPMKVDLVAQLEEMSLQNRAALASAVLFADPLPDGSSLDGSDKADSEKEVKPILTKERRNEEGYKSVWFKEDIDPNAKEEVVIIPDSGERDADEEEEDSMDEEDGEDVSPPTPQSFNKNGALDSDSEGDDADM
ncbi:hypothetical protein AAFF_G00283210 [Aldrovandia affinis]|uniref:Cadherin domain-containing protein n=1 Tax=Aldrovandia affinis TaxID=143900 RepID=A0AAD7T9Y6_9TELE|nr:hypothetical protein AAFF_G00283210 [Aldrovandia affinis]